jgi:integrative and conjugative element protein (TIGR02256 family)
MVSWIALHPQWFLRELELLKRHYPDIRVDERRLDRGELVLWGELKVRPPGGAKSHPVCVVYHQASPFEHPMVFPIEAVPNLDGEQLPQFDPKFFDRRHQMPSGHLCLFQRDTRGRDGGDVVDLLQVLRRAQQWFLGLHTGRWPPDTADSELEAHFTYVSDVLLAERFFGDDVRGHGRFYMIPDLRRMIDASSDYEHACPMVVTAMTEETGIVKVLDARRELADIYPWIKADDWDPNRMAALPQRNAGVLGKPEQGYWWTLPAEPSPFRDGAGLLAVLEQVARERDAWRMIRSELGGDLAAADRHYVALQYPARFGGSEWLFLVLPNQARRAGGGVLVGGDERRAFEKLPVLCYRAQSIRRQDLWRRNETVLDEAIKGKTVALIGLGALGSRVAELLAQAGVGKFKLIDMDRLKPVNVARHIGGISDFGASKVRVVMSRLLNINPRLRFSKDDAVCASADSSIDRLARFIRDADIVISTTADEGVESIVNQVAVTLRKPVLYGRSLRRASVGRVFLVRPGADACKACLATYAHAGRAGRAVPADWIDVPEAPDDVLLHECGRPLIAGSAAHLSFISTLTASVAIDFLQGMLRGANHWLWVRNPAPELNPRLASALSTVSGTLPPSADCTVCREPPISGVVIPDELRDSILAETMSTPTVETGGVLAGYIDGERRAVVTRVIGPGPTAVKSATRFHRDVEYAQAELDRTANELGDRGAYIGEWHSHLEAAPEPSPMDVRSLSGIAAAPNYLTCNPLMLIAAFDPAAAKAVALRAWVFVAGGRFYRLRDVYTA